MTTESLTEARRAAFLIDLEALTRKHGIAVTGCGCCGSPDLVGVDTSDPQAGYRDDHVQWIDPSNEYLWQDYAASIVKAVQEDRKS